jgi:hypothetical protein
LSPPGAYTPNPSLTGKATFGFVAKAHKGASAPVGDAEFMFKVADLQFHSTSYDWLVIAGAKAQFKGSRTINRQGDYAFMITATDGNLRGGHGTDMFRMKIWSKTSGGVIYDNNRGASDSSDPTTVLGGGSITIQQK